MLVKAGRTKDLTSYSLGNIVLANLGNLIYAVYVVSLPLGPVWALHGFHLGATGLMLFWYLRHTGKTGWQDKAQRKRPDQPAIERNLSARVGKSDANVFHTAR
jgi:hypothetical protein